jgi:U3 small nucleolar RNA-associated protein 15
MVMGEHGDKKGGGSLPVEQVLMFPSGTIAISSAGPIIRIWDIVAGGRCTRALSNHQKTVTALSFDAHASRLLTGGLDHMVKVYDVSTYKVVHTMRYPAPILCLAISVRYHLCPTFFQTLNPTQPDESHIVAGMSDGTLSVRRRQIKLNEGSTVDASRSSDFGSFLGVTVPGIGQGTVRERVRPKPTGDVNELRVESKRKKRLKDYDKLLKSFKYSAALDAVLRKVGGCNSHHILSKTDPV